MTATALIEADGRRSIGVLVSRGVADLVAGARRHELWVFMGWREVRKHYQRSVIGPLWLTLNMGLLVAGIGTLYSQVMQQDIQNYLPFLAVGFITWALIGPVINEACTVFSQSATSIRQVQMPLSVHVYQFMWRHLITFLHNFSIYLVVALIFGIWPGINGLMFLPALAIILLNGFFVCLILGPLSARFRDIPPIAASVTQIFFFMTPIFWSPDSLPDRALFLVFNPFYHLIEIVRRPLLGETASLLNWTVCLSGTLVLGVVALLFFSRFRSRIPYWA